MNLSTLPPVPSFGALIIATPEEIMAGVAGRNGLTVEGLIKGGRAEEIYWPRALAMALIYRLLGLSMARIGKIFNGMDHATILYAMRRVKERCDIDPAFAECLQTWTHYYMLEKGIKKTPPTMPKFK